MTRVGIVVALAGECRSMTHQRVPKDVCLPVSGHCLLALSGAGPAAAARTAVRLTREGASALLSWGCAAALDPHLNSGDLIIPRRVVGADGTSLETSVAWRDKLTRRLADRLSIHSDNLLESSEIIATPSEKAGIFAATGAIALDMESAAIARVAREHDLPFVAIRAIADPAALALPASVLAAMDETGSVRISMVLGHAVLNPGDFIGLIRLGWHFRAAMKTLSEVKALAGSDLAAP